MRKLFFLFGILLLSASSYAVQGWMWFNQFPWVYSHEDENWIYVATEIEVSLYDSGKWSKQDDSYLSNLGWVWMNRFPWCYSHKEKKWIYITRPSSSVKDVVVIELKDGPVIIETFRDAAPNHVERIEKLASSGQYDGVVFHRVIEGFMAQTGDVQHGKIDNFQDSLVGTGRSELPELNSEFNDIKHVRGTCSMARANDPHSANSQFFICFEQAPFLDNQYTVWGQVIEGMEYVDQIKVGDDIENGKVADPDHMVKVTVQKYAPIHVYGVWNKEWSELESYKHDWDKQYTKWILDPEPYGGLDVLRQIKEAKDSGTTLLDLGNSNISDITPLDGLSDLTVLYLHSNNISDLTPLAGLTNLTQLLLYKNNISDITPLAGLTNLSRLGLWDNSISDITPLAGLTNLTILELGGSKITDLTPLAGLTNLTSLTLSYISNSDISLLAELTNLTDVRLWYNNISDITTLAELTNLEWLGLSNNNISDITPLAGLTNLTVLYLEENPISSSQKAMLEEALPNTNITWPDVIIDDSQETPSSTHTAQLNNGVSLEMIWVEAGTFTMGQDGVATPVHEVTLTNGFYLGKYEVTQAQYEAVMTGNSDGLSATPSQWPNNPNRPVEKVSWDDVQVFLTLLNAQEAGNIPAGWAYVLPTEAQWEYACRAGTTTAYSWGDTITEENANYGQNIGQTTRVGQYEPNRWGIFDMLGNVSEWCSVSYSFVDPIYKSERGGSWESPYENLRVSALLAPNAKTDRLNNIGFRVGFQQQ